jgi:mannose-6-phosphate isomerase-like protein (cupin superfamily)
MLSFSYYGEMPKRRDILRWAAGANAAALFAAGPGKLPDTVIDPSRARLTREPFGELRIYFEGPTDKLGWMTAGSLLLKGGMSPHPPHQHPEEEFLLITEGAGEVTIAGTVTKVGPGSMLYCAADKLHGITNTGKAPLLFYFWKWK